jgi:uncharacterized FAD-dependent dehydrogenase
MSTDVESTQVGVRYADGTVDWNAAAGWGDFTDPNTQSEFQRNYAARIRDLGGEPQPVEFVQRLVVTTYGEVSLLAPSEPTLTDTIPGDESDAAAVPDESA